MAVDSVTVGTLVSRVGFYLTNNATVETALSTEIKFALNSKLHEFVVQTDHPSFITEDTVAVTTQDTALDDDFVRMVNPGVKHNASPYETLAYYEQQDYDSVNGTQLWSTTGKPRMYTIRGRNTTTGRYDLRVTPTPDTSYTLRYTYLAKPTSISAASDATEVDRRLPREHTHFLVAGAAVLFPQFLTSVATLQKLEATYQEGIAMVRNAHPVTGRITQHKMGGVSRNIRVSWPTALSGIDLTTP